jgi:hypothetical protein
MWVGGGGAGGASAAPGPARPTAPWGQHTAAYPARRPAPREPGLTDLPPSSHAPRGFYFWKRPWYNLLVLWVLSHACLHPAQWLFSVTVVIAVWMLRRAAIQVGTAHPLAASRPGPQRPLPSLSHPLAKCSPPPPPPSPQPQPQPHPTPTPTPTPTPAQPPAQPPAPTPPNPSPHTPPGAPRSARACWASRWRRPSWWTRRKRRRRRTPSQSWPRR